MSDCSTEAFKTGFEIEYDIQPFCESCEHDLGYLMQARVSADVNAAYVELQRRCERLKQTAVELVHVIEFIRQDVDPVLDVVMERTKNTLRECGVSLDD